MQNVVVLVFVLILWPKSISDVCNSFLYADHLAIAHLIAAKHCPLLARISLSVHLAQLTSFIFSSSMQVSSIQGKLQYMRVLNDLPPFGGFLFHTVGLVT